jgi:hypothetical protein
MRTGSPIDLDKCIREERQTHISCVLLGLFLFAISVYWLNKALGEAVNFIDVGSSSQGSFIVFDFAFAAAAGVGFLAAGVSFFVRAAMSGPNQKAIRILSEKIAELDNKIKEMSKSTVASDSEAHAKDDAASELAQPQR